MRVRRARNGTIVETIRVRVGSSSILDVKVNQCNTIQGIQRPVKATRATLTFCRNAATDPTTVQLTAVEPTSGIVVHQSPTIPSSINNKSLTVRWPAAVARYPANSQSILLQVRHGTFQTADSTTISGILKIFFTYGLEISEVTSTTVLASTSSEAEPLADAIAHMYL